MRFSDRHRGLCSSLILYSCFETKDRRTIRRGREAYSIESIDETPQIEPVFGCDGRAYWWPQRPGPIQRQCRGLLSWTGCCGCPTTCLPADWWPEPARPCQFTGDGIAAGHGQPALRNGWHRCLPSRRISGHRPHQRLQAVSKQHSNQRPASASGWFYKY